METRIGQITHFYNRISVAVLSLTKTLELGDTIHILGITTDFTQKVASMEIEHQKISSAYPGDEVALKVTEPARKGDAIYKIIEGKNLEHLLCVIVKFESLFYLQS